MSALQQLAHTNSSMHNHCTMCDGKNTAFEMATAAYNAGFTDFGFSCHGAPFYMDSYCVSNNNFAEYEKTINELKLAFKGKMNIYLGIEQDYLSPVAFRQNLDYLIGAVHDVYCEKTNKFYWVDGDAQMFEDCINNMFNGNAMLLVKHFYKLSARNAKKHKPDIIAHFDLIIKNNKGNIYFNENSEEYKKLALTCLNECIKTNAVFEINTGGIYRGYRKTPYPSDFILHALCKQNAPITLSADAHDVKGINYHFIEMEKYLKDIGFNYIYVFSCGNFAKKML